MKPPFNAEYQYRCAINAALSEPDSCRAIDSLVKHVEAIDERRAEYEAMTDEQYDTFIRLRDYFSENGAD